MVRRVAATAITRPPRSVSTTVRRSVIVQLPAACAEHVTATLTVRPATRGVPTWVSEIAPSPPAGTVTNALVALALPPALVAVTRHCRWCETSALPTT